MLIVGLLVKSQIPRVRHILLEGLWTAFAQLLHRRIIFLLQHFVCPLSLRLVLEQLVLVGVRVLRVEFLHLRHGHVPWEIATSHEIDQDDTKRLEIIPTRVLIAFVSA